MSYIEDTFGHKKKEKKPFDNLIFTPDVPIKAQIVEIKEYGEDTKDKAFIFKLNINSGEHKDKSTTIFFPLKQKNSELSITLRLFLNAALMEEVIKEIEEMEAKGVKDAATLNGIVISLFYKNLDKYQDKHMFFTFGDVKEYTDKDNNQRKMQYVTAIEQDKVPEKAQEDSVKEDEEIVF